MLDQEEEQPSAVSNTEVPDWLARFQPQRPLAVLVEELNSTFHAYDAENYARVHPEIYDFLPNLWREMISLLPGRDHWRILDFGCGAGFEAQQVLAGLGDKVQVLVCYDPSDAMLAQCRLHLCAAKVVAFSSALREVADQGPFNLLVTNSVLHHLADIHATILSLMPHLTSDAWWISGHEPSSRFYRNISCTRLLEEYRAYRRWKRFVDPVSYVSRLRLLRSKLHSKDPLTLTAQAAARRGLFKRVPPPLVVDRIVDFHVAHSAEEAAAGRGLDFETMRQDLAAQWNLRRVKTYFFLGSYLPRPLPRRWLERTNKLAELFPNDGANFCTVWSRNS
jgi:SAM-dependent methyltransferase